MRWWNPLLIALAAGCADGATLQERGDGQEARPCEGAACAAPCAGVTCTAPGAAAPCAGSECAGPGCAEGCLPGCTFADEATQPRWIYEPPAGARISFPAIADEAGRLYWRERGDAACATVAADLDGLVHYRADSPCLPGEATMLRRGGLLLTQGAEVILAHVTADGSLAWRHDVAQTPGCETSLEEVAASGEVLYAIRSERCGAGTRGWGVSVIDLVTGAARHHGPSDRSGWIVADALVLADADGNGHLRWGLVLDDGSHRIELFSLDSHGTERWRITSVHPWDPASEEEDDRFEPVAVAGGRLFTREAGRRLAARATDTAARIVELPVAPTLVSRPAPVRGGSFFAASGDGAATFVLAEDGSLRRSDGGQQRWRLDPCADLGLCTTPDLLHTDAGGLLLWATDRSWPDGEEVRTSRLVELEGDGSVRRACAAASGVGHLAVLRDGLLITQGAGGLAAYVVPGLAEAARGWSSAGGGPSRGGWER